MKPADIIQAITSQYAGVLPQQSWGETSLFYNPGALQPSGVYFCTLKEDNGKNDQASALDRDGVFRFSIGIAKQQYTELFGTPPKRPKKGQTVATGHDFSLQNELMPHPMYAWMSWVQVLNPSKQTFADIEPLIINAYAKAVEKFLKKI